MKFYRSRLWIIILGGIIGLVLGVVGAYFSLGERWERVWYPALAPDKDRAVELVGYDSYDPDSGQGTLYIKGQSQTLYGCSADPYRNNSDCHVATAESLAKSVKCPGIVTRFDDPPGKVISRIVIFDCRYNGYSTVQTNYSILDDGSIWKLRFDDWERPLRNGIIIIFAVLGTVMGIVIGAIISALSKERRRSSA